MGLTGLSGLSGLYGGFSPLDLSPALWLDAADLSTLFQDSSLTTPVTSDGDVIGGCKDKSGNARHATQATTAKKPLYKVGIQNGRPVLRFDGVDDLLQTANFALSQPWTFFAVLRYHTAYSTGNNTAFDGATTNSGRFFRASSTQIQLHASAALSITTTPGNWHVFTGVFNGASSSLTIDNGAATTGNVGSNNPGLLTLGNTAAGTEGAPIDLAEFVAIGGPVSAPNTLQLRSYLNTKWAVY